MRRQLFDLIARKWLGMGDGAKLPWRPFGLFCILFPSTILQLLYHRDKLFRYDPRVDIFTIYGIKYSGQFFRAFSSSGLPIDQLFRITMRDVDGQAQIERISLDGEVSRLFQDLRSHFRTVERIAYTMGSDEPTWTCQGVEQALKVVEAQWHRGRRL